VLLTSNALASSVATAQFALDLSVLDALAEATATFATTIGLLAGLTALLLVEMFATVNVLGVAQAKDKYGVAKK
jgi:uncharacterized membrane protein